MMRKIRGEGTTMSDVSTREMERGTKREREREKEGKRERERRERKEVAA